MDEVAAENNTDRGVRGIRVQVEVGLFFFGQVFIQVGFCWTNMCASYM